MANRDIVVVGTSAGGVDSLTALAHQLPADFPAAVLAVIHIPPYTPSYLDETIGRSCSLKVCTGRDGQRITAGHFYLAPPDQHMLVEDRRVLLTRGPHENRVRPAVDPLFRSAGVAHGPRVIGVILTGALDDGAAGLAAIKRCGGTAIVQDPQDAAYPDMPRNAMRAVQPDHVVPLDRMGALLAELTREPVKADLQAPADLVREVQMSKRKPKRDPEQDMQAWGQQVSMSCPECGGPLRESREGDLRRYRCHTGHIYGAQSLLAEQADKAEAALWTAVRTLEERDRMLSMMAQDEEKRGHKTSARSCVERAAEAREHAKTLRALLGEQEKAVG